MRNFGSGLGCEQGSFDVLDVGEAPESGFAASRDEGEGAADPTEESEGAVSAGTCGVVESPTLEEGEPLQPEAKASVPMPRTSRAEKVMVEALRAILPQKRGFFPRRTRARLAAVRGSNAPSASAMEST